MGGDGAWDHLNSSEGRRRADLEVRNVRVAQKTDLLIDVTIRHPFIGAGRSGHNQGRLRNPDNPDHILENAAADKIRNYRDTHVSSSSYGTHVSSSESSYDTHRRNLHVATSLLLATRRPST